MQALVETLKVCSGCGKSKTPLEFTKKKSSPDGLGSYCFACHRAKCREYYLANKEKMNAASRENYRYNREHYLELNRKRYVENRDQYRATNDAWNAQHKEKMDAYYRDRLNGTRAWVRSLKEGCLCVDCGGLFPPEVLEYDHIKGVKRHNIAKMANHSRKQILKEIAKCELVCCNCHRIRSHQRRKLPWTKRLVLYRAWIAEMKKSPCADCGFVSPPEAMDFDHVRGGKIQQVTDMWSWGRDKVLAEIAKCDLVCGNCHRIRTVSRQADSFDLCSTTPVTASSEPPIHRENV